MGPQQLIEQLARRGISLSVDDDRLRLRAPRGRLDPELRARIEADKPALIAHLKRRAAAPAPAASPAEDEPFPLTPVQQAYWLGRQGVDADGPVSTYAYFESDIDDLDPARLRAAITRLVAHHPMLRVRIDDEGRQRTPSAPPPVRLPITDLSGHTPAARDEALAEMRAALSHQILPAETGPLFDVRAARIGPRTHRLFFGLDLLVCDIASGLLLAGQALALYDDPQHTLPAIDLSFRDYVLATAARREGEAEAAARAWWSTRIQTLPPAPSLPWCAPPAGTPSRFVRHRGQLDPARWSRFSAHARQRGLTPAAALATAYAEALAGWSRRAPMTLNLTLFDRKPIHPHVDRLVGDFTETLLLAVDPGPPLGFAERADEVQRSLWAALEHAALGGVEVLRMLNRARPGAAARMPVVFTAALRREGEPPLDPRITAGFEQIVYGVSQTPQVWLDHQAIELGDRLVFNWDAVEARFPPGLLDAMFAAYVALIERLADDPAAWDRPADVSPPGLDRLWAGYNAVAEERPTGAEGETLWTLFARQAAAAPDRPAVIPADGAALTYGALAARAAAVHRALGDVKPGERVAIVMARHPAQAAAALGIGRAGATYLPLDAHWPAARILEIIERAGVRRITTTADLATTLPWPAGLPVIAVDALPDAADDAAPPPAPQDARWLAYVIYTSGSTGRPKGVMIDHRGAVNTLLDINHRFAVGPDDRILGLSSLSFDLSVYDLFGLFAAGGAVVLPAADADRDPTSWLDGMRTHRPSLWNSVPALMEMLVEHTERAGGRWPASLRHVLLSGDWIPVSLPDRIRALGDGVEVTSLGGATEASIWSIAHPIGAVDTTRPSIPYGRPLTGQSMWVLDPRLRPCPLWAVGELYIGGIGVARGYADDPRQTAARFIEHPETGARLYRTGDLGRLRPDGAIEFLGREDGQVKIGGHRIELGEITAALEAHPAVRAAVVDARGEPPGPRRLVAYVVPQGDDPLDRDALRAHLAASLPRYMVPEQWVSLDGLPLGANGKVDRRRLPAPEAPRGGRPPATEMERTIAGLWSALIGRDAVAVDEDFFIAGGDSLAAVRLVAEVRRALGIYVPLRRFFAEPTIAALAALCSPDALPPGPTLPEVLADPDNALAPFPLTDLQHAYWIGRMGGLELGRVACQVYIETATDSIDAERLQGAVRHLIERHPALRTIVRSDGQQQVLAAVPPYVIEVDDLRALPADRAMARLEETRRRMSEALGDPARWPLFEWRVTHLPDGSRVHLRQDALFADGWSLFLILDQVQARYADPTVALPTPELTFRDYVLAGRDVARSEAWQRASAYWDARLDTLPPGPELPLAIEPEQIEQPRFVRRAHVIPHRRWAEMQARVRARGATPATALIAAFAHTLAGWSRRRRFTLNLTLFNRLQVHRDIDAVIGDFTTTSLLACDPDGDGPFEDTVARLQARLWSDLDHRLVGGVEVLRRLAARDGDGLRARMPVVFTSTLGFKLLGRSALGDPVHVTSQTPQVWLDHQVWDHPDGVCLSWDAVDALFPPGLVDEMFAAYVATVERLIDDDGAWSAPDGLPGALPPAQAERRRALQATEGPRPAGLLHQGAFEQAARTPDAPAVIAAETVSYRALIQRARLIGDRLIALGARPGAPVAVMMPKGPGQVAALLGVLDAGAPYLPIDPNQPAARIERLLAHGRVDLAIVAAEQAPALPAGITPVAVMACDGMLMASEPSGMAYGMASEPSSMPYGMASDAMPAFRARCAPDDLAYVIYTSGSTGHPKGVMIDHQAALNTVDDVNTRWSWGPADRVFGISRASFDLSVQDVFGTLAAGAALVLPPADGLRDPSAWLDPIERSGVTVWSSVPTLMEMLVTHAEGRGVGLASLRLVMLSGDWIPLSLPDRIRALAPAAEVVSLGGATEGSIWSIAYPIEAVDPRWRSVPYGRPMRNQTVYVLDDELAERPEHAVGEIYIGGVGVARGYWRDPEQTAARFVTHPRTGERLYRTGDLGRYRPEGDIEFLGRADFQVKIGGHRVELGEVEAALLACPEVEQAVVTMVGDPRGQRRLAAYVVPATGVTAAALPAPHPAALPSAALPADGPALISDPAERLAVKLSRPGLRRDLADAEAVALPAPSADEAPIERWRSRRSVRHFVAAPLPLAALAGLLAELRPQAVPESPLPKYRYPSAGDLYPVQVYIAVAPGRVEGLPGGVWYHDPVAHRLRRVSGALPSARWHAPANRSWVEGAAFTALLVGRLPAITPLYGPHGPGFCRLEAGYMGQLLMSRAAELGLGLCPVGGLDAAVVGEALGLGDDHPLQHALVGGAPDDRRDATPEHAAPAVVFDVERVRAAIAARLPRYMVPDTLTVLDRLPLSANGKVDRKALPDPERAAPRRPASPSEARLAQMLGELVGADDLPVDRNLFDLGCTSLHIVQLHNRLLAELAVELPITTMFRRPTIAELALALAELIGEPDPAPAPPADATPAAAAPLPPTPPAPAPAAPALAPTTPAPTPPTEAAPALTRPIPRLDADAPIAIVGVAARLPGAADAAAFQRNVRAGLVSITRLDPATLTAVPPEVRDAPDFVPAAALMDDVWAFDADFFGFTEREAELTDPQKRVFLEHCLRALEDAGIAPGDPPGPIGVFGGESLSRYYIRDLRAARARASAPSVADFQRLVGNDKDYLATLAAYRLGFEGPALGVQSACSTSLVAVHLACQSLRAGECAVALAGGVTVRILEESGYRLTLPGMYAADGRCRPFDAAASGTVFGSGVGVVALRPLADALADGDPVLAVIRGSAVSNDGRQRAGFTAPGHAGQVRALAGALARAAVDPATVDYLEAHGTGTPLGDPIEIGALAEAYRLDTRPAGRPLVIGAVKANVGHLESAAGVAGLIKTAQALAAAELPPQPEFDSGNPAIPFERLPVEVGVRRRPWPATPGRPRRAAVSAFGIGGTNAHVVLEEAPPPAPAPDDGRPRLLPLSARDPEALRRLAERVRDRLAADEGPLGDLCYAAAVGRDHHHHRLAVIGADRATLMARLDAYLADERVGGLFVGACWLDGAARQTPVKPTGRAPGDLAGLAGAYISGARVDWRALYADERRRKARLPGYPLSRRIHRILPEPEPEATPAPGSAAPHPMIDRFVPGPRSFIAEGDLSCRRLPLVADHVIDGQPLLPGVAWLEMCRVAAGRWSGDPGIGLADVRFEVPLALAPSAARRVQVVLTPTRGGEARIEAFARDDEGEWTLHVTGRALPVDEAPPALPTLDGGAAVDVTALFARFEESRIHYGPRMRALTAARHADGLIAAAATLPLNSAQPGWAVHPALLDASLHAVGAALVGAADSAAGPYVPAELGRLTVWSPLPPAVLIRARVERGSGDGVIADVELYGDDGARLARMDRMVFRRLSAGRVDGLYRVLWRRRDRVGSAGSAGRWLVVCEPAVDAPPLARWLAEAGAEVVERPFDANPGAAADGGFDGIAWLAGAADPIERVSRATALVGALARAGVALSAGLYFITRGATPAGHEQRVDRPGHAALWGLATACAAERPELGPALLDLDPLGASEAAADVLGELLGADREPTVALRRAGRFVPRMTIDPGPPPSPPGLPDHGRWHLAITARGSLDGLRFVSGPPPIAALPPTGVEAAVLASGLNFRDVLNALGLYPGDPGPLGSEFAGVVTRVGAAVTRVAVGDRVFGLTPRGIGDTIDGDERLIAPIPAGVSAEQAAGLALAGLTAHIGLLQLGGLEAGQRVLIHAATGGVGLVALQIARLAGAEIHATASRAKWPTLRALGVEHIYDSRTTDFAEAVRAATGGEGVDVVLSALTLDGLEASLRATRPGGVVVDIAKGDVGDLLARWPDRRYVAFDLGERALEDTASVTAALDALAAGYARGALTPPPMRVEPAERAIEALRDLARGRHVGKFVISQVARRRRLAGWPGRVPPGGVLITGGLGDLGLATARQLAERGAERLVLLGRRPPGTDDQRAQIAAIEAAGAAVRIELGDVAAPGVAARVIEAMVAEGPLAGVIHAAGVIDDGLIGDLDRARVEAVVAPKVRGAWALHATTRRFEPGFFALYGSATALLGSPGQAPYAAANAALAGLAEHRRGLGLPATVIDWGPWAGIGMAARLDEVQRQRMAGGGIRAIAPADAFAALWRIWESDRTRAVLAPFDRDRLTGPAPPLLAELLDEAGADDGGPLLDRLGRAAPAERAALLAAHIGAVVCRTLGIDPEVGVDPGRPLTELGVDSLIALELRNTLSRSLDRRLPATMLFDYPTVEALSRWLADGIGDAIDGTPDGSDGINDDSDGMPDGSDGINDDSDGMPDAMPDRPPEPAAADDADLGALDAPALAALLLAELDDDDEDDR